jgi:putative phosphoribosyl transferase
MYFASRVQAGRMLAAQLVPKYRYENCVVVALNNGGVTVGAEIAMQLHCMLLLLVSAEILLPREPEALAGITANGTVAYNHSYSDGEIVEMESEYFGLIAQEKLSRMHELNRLSNGSGAVSKRLLKGRNVIVVSDGLKSGFRVDIAAEFLKPIAVDKFIVATPFAGVEAVDHMHVQADELYCLSTITDYVTTDHYYDEQDVPNQARVLKIVEHIILDWK